MQGKWVIGSGPFVEKSSLIIVLIFFDLKEYPFKIAQLQR